MESNQSERYYTDNKSATLFVAYNAIKPHREKTISSIAKHKAVPITASGCRD